MSKYVNNSSSSGLTFPGALTIAFIVLKLTHVIDWPWLWVLSPLWISLLTAVAILLIAGLVLLIVWLVEKKQS